LDIQKNFPNIFYHATLLQHVSSISNKILIHRPNANYILDFGKGFYTTENYQQALDRAMLLQENERNPKNRVLSKQHRGVIVSFELNSTLMYTINKDRYKFFPFKDKEWADYIVFNRINRKLDTPQKYIWTYGSLADGKYLGFLCRQYVNGEIDVNQLINGYTDGHDKIRGIAPYSEDYTQLSFHEDEDFVNSALMYKGFCIIDQNTISQKRW
jgi:hypothetical protein